MDFYKFKNQDLINLALNHSSYANENKNRGIKCNERLEFLGDAILSFVVGEHIYNRFKDWPEGKLTKLRASVVCEGMLAKKGRELMLNEKIKLGKGEELTGGRERNSIIADSVEAFIGAIYLDGGIEPAREFVLSMLKEEIEKVSSSFESLDSKTTLQEIIQKYSYEPIEYIIVAEHGPAHNKIFEAEVKHGGNILGKGKGTSKKAAEQDAATKAIEILGTKRKRQR